MFTNQEIIALISSAFEVIDAMERNVDNLTVTYFRAMSRKDLRN